MSDIDMEVTEARAHMQRVAQFAQQVGQEWKTAKSKVAVGEAGVGTGVLADKFGKLYYEPREMISIGVDGMQQKIQQLADAGFASADAYQSHQQAAADGFQNGPR
jgi:hypothetical protein